ncbi:hypothetical protein [Streptomyces sp. NPDC058683]|uniref:hypothetical protein n=1 Tax=Streptomyces sp. NPDC058683 TaxID=3346597 RepID=UPI00364D0301
MGWPVGVARAALRAIERNRPYVVVGITWKITSEVPRVLPRSVMARMGERMMRPQKG